DISSSAQYSAMSAAIALTLPAANIALAIRLLSASHLASCSAHCRRISSVMIMLPLLLLRSGFAPLALVRRAVTPATPSAYYPTRPVHRLPLISSRSPPGALPSAVHIGTGFYRLPPLPVWGGMRPGSLGCPPPAWLSRSVRLSESIVAHIVRFVNRSRKNFFSPRLAETPFASAFPRFAPA